MFKIFKNNVIPNSYSKNFEIIQQYQKNIKNINELEKKINQNNKLIIENAIESLIEDNKILSNLYWSIPDINEVDSEHNLIKDYSDKKIDKFKNLLLIPNGINYREIILGNNTNNIKDFNIQKLAYILDVNIFEINDSDKKKESEENLIQNLFSCISYLSNIQEKNFKNEFKKKLLILKQKKFINYLIFYYKNDLYEIKNVIKNVLNLNNYNIYKSNNIEYNKETFIKSVFDIFDILYFFNLLKNKSLINKDKKYFQNFIFIENENFEITKDIIFYYDLKKDFKNLLINLNLSILKTENILDINKVKESIYLNRKNKFKNQKPINMKNFEELFI